MALTKFLLEMLDEGKWRVTSPEDVGVHLVADSPNEAIRKARFMADDLRKARAES